MKQTIQATKIETYIVDLPTIRPHKLSMTTMQKQSMVIVRLFCSDGIVGIGEATTIGGLSYGDESPEGMKLTIDQYIAPALKLCDISNLNSTVAHLNKLIKRNRIAKSAIETAMLDAQGKRLNLSVSELLRGPISNSLPILWTLASGDTGKRY